MLSVARGDDEQNNDVYVYEYSKESEGQLGAWSRYDNFNVSVWGGLTGNDYFGTGNGQVYKLRNSDTVADYSDNGVAITATMTLGATHFGAPNERKLCSHIFTSFDASYDMDGTVISIGTDLNTSFTATTPVSIDSNTHQVEMFKSSTPTRKATLFQVKVINSTIYEPVTLTGVGYSVALLSGHGIKEAVDS